jgi:hypothetical protein
MNDLIYKKDEYNGWRNYETWNVILWINNDQSYYNSMKRIYNERSWTNTDIRLKPFSTLYEAFVLRNDLYKSKTPDGVLWADRKIDLDQINEHMNEVFRNEE